MKKLSPILFVLSIVLILSACGSSDVLGDFIEDYNEKAAESGVAKLNPDDFDEEIEDVEGTGWQGLYESVEYDINAKYADMENVSGYHLSIDIEQPYEKLEGVGYDAGIAIVDTLELDKEKYEKQYKLALSDTNSRYEDNGYTITFLNNGLYYFAIYFDKTE